MRNKSIKINATLNVIKTLMSVFFPLITYPYILHVLDTDGVGKVSYISSIVSYFTMIAMLGISTYAVREGSKVRDDKEAFSKLVSQIFSINIFSTVLSCILLTVSVFCINKFSEYKILFLILGFSIVFQVFSIDWVNTIFEDFAFITIRTIIIYIINLVLVFLLIKKPEDYLVYAILTVLPSGIVCLLNWYYCKRYVNLRFTRHMCISHHIKPLLILFANTLAVSIYVNFDITMLGWYKGDYYAGLYSVSAKMYSIVKASLGAIYAVTVPRLAYFVGENDYPKYKLLYSKTWGILSIILIPASVGLICLADDVVVTFGGVKYVEAADSLRVLSIALIFAIFGGLITACLNVTIGKEKDNLIATLISAITNFLLNLFFIPIWGTIGAAITTVISEFLVLFICYISVKDKSKYFDKRIVLTNLGHSLLGTVMIVIFYQLVSPLIEDNIIRLCVIIPCSILLYGIMLIIIKNEILLALLKQVFSNLKK